RLANRRFPERFDRKAFGRGARGGPVRELPYKLPVRELEFRLRHGQGNARMEPRRDAKNVRGIGAVRVRSQWKEYVRRAIRWKRAMQGSENRISPAPQRENFAGGIAMKAAIAETLADHCDPGSPGLILLRGEGSSQRGMGPEQSEVAG